MLPTTPIRNPYFTATIFFLTYLATRGAVSMVAMEAMEMVQPTNRLVAPSSVAKSGVTTDWEAKLAHTRDESVE
jgi:hypothetical protein